MFNWIIGWLVDLSWRKILVPLLFILFRKKRNNHYSVYLFNTCWKPSNENFEHDAIKRDTYTVHTSLLLYFSAPSERRLASNRTPFSGEKEMVTILLERREFIRATHFTSAELFLGCSSAIAVGSKLWASLVDNLLPLTALLLKGQSDCEIPAAKIWPPTRTPVRDCISSYFSERLT